MSFGRISYIHSTPVDEYMSPRTVNVGIVIKTFPKFILLSQTPANLWQQAGSRNIWMYITYCKYSGKTGILFSLLLRILCWAQIVGYVLACRWYSFVCTLHHFIIIIVQTYLKTLNLKMPLRYILSSVWVRLSIFSQISIIQYIGRCLFSLHISLVIIERIYSLSYQHHQIGSMNLGLGHETMVFAVCLSIFLCQCP